MIIRVAVFERLFREVASLDVDKDDLKRLSDVIRDKIRDLLVVSEAKAKQDGRDIITMHDLPITKGLQESMVKFRRLDVAVEVEPVLAQLAGLPPLDLGYDEEVEQSLGELAGTITVVLAEVMKTMDGSLKNPSTEHWEKVHRILDLTL